ncbi:MAG: 4-alpha-glucanotransferase [Prevotella sp.]|nr:4-alpha-glucanotransferase [Prevotella sp.]
MTLLFNLEYQTAFGEELVLNILSDDGAAHGHSMTTADGVHWTCELALAGKAGTHFDYYYSVARGSDVVRTEWLTVPHRLELAAVRGARYVMYDHWIDTPEDSYMYSSAFTECVMSRERQLSTKTEFQCTVRLKVRAPQLRQGQRLAISGAAAYLGAWDVQQALPMTEHEYHEWVVSLDAERLPGHFEFKFVILSGDATLWESGSNRFVELPEVGMKKGDVFVYELPQAYFPVYPWKGAGTVIPVFSLRSEGSFGVGDFGDLKLMIDWCAKTGQRILQILPINDTNMTGSWQDSYPYNSISIYALHPQYTDLRQLPPLKDEARRQHYEQLRQELNALPQIDYERMFSTKIEYLRELFAQEGGRVKRTKAYKEFVEQNRNWLEPYALFCLNRDKFGTAEFEKWDHDTEFKPAKEGSAPEGAAFWYFVQFNLDQQMRAAHAHARSQRVILKGDIPIGISRDGVEAWVEPRYFNLNGQAGAPPDAFSEDGQNWGFPTYNWDEMLKDGCQWWVRRFRKMAQYFDAYRIDHVLGFFRIWEIPVPHKSGLYGQFQPSLPMSRDEIGAWGLPFREEFYLEDHKQKDMWHPRINAPKMEAFAQLSWDEQQHFWNMYNDYFYRRNNQFWYEEAMKKLPRLTQATRMLCCAEDLGMVPDCVPWVMNQLRILSLEIQSMPKDPAVRFGHLSRNPYRSVCTISTHDMSTLRQWWDEDLEQTQNYYNTMLYREGPAPHPLPGWLAKDIVSRHLTSPSMLCLLSLQDWLSISEKYRLPDQNAERINIPANPRHYWRYRMHLTIEQLLQADDFNDEVDDLIASSGRR